MKIFALIFALLLLKCSGQTNFQDMASNGYYGVSSNSIYGTLANSVTLTSNQVVSMSGRAMSGSNYIISVDTNNIIYQTGKAVAGSNYLVTVDTNNIVMQAGNAISGSNYLTSVPLSSTNWVPNAISNAPTIAVGNLQATNCITLATNTPLPIVTAGLNCANAFIMTNASRSQYDFVVREVFAAGPVSGGTNFVVSGLSGYANPVRPMFFNVTPGNIAAANSAGSGNGYSSPSDSWTATGFTIKQLNSVTAMANTTNDIRFLIFGGN